MLRCELKLPGGAIQAGAMTGTITNSGAGAVLCGSAQGSATISNLIHGNLALMLANVLPLAGVLFLLQLKLITLLLQALLVPLSTAEKLGELAVAGCGAAPSARAARFRHRFPALCRPSR